MGHEKSLTALLPALAGANIIFGMGMTDLGVTFSFVQLIIDDMLVEGIKGVISGDISSKAVYDPDRLSYLAKKNRPSRSWASPGVRKPRVPLDHGLPSGPDIVSEAREKLKDILAYHKPEPLPPAARRKIREIIIEEESRKTTSGRYRMVQL